MRQFGLRLAQKEWDLLPPAMNTHCKRAHWIDLTDVTVRRLNDSLLCTTVRYSTIVQYSTALNWTPEPACLPLQYNGTVLQSVHGRNNDKYIVEIGTSHTSKLMTIKWVGIVCSMRLTRNGDVHRFKVYHRKQSCIEIEFVYKSVALLPTDLVYKCNCVMRWWPWSKKFEIDRRHRSTLIDSSIWMLMSISNDDSCWFLWGNLIEFGKKTSMGVRSLEFMPIFWKGTSFKLLCYPKYLLVPLQSRDGEPRSESWTSWRTKTLPLVAYALVV